MEDQHAATQALASTVQELRADIDFNFDHMLQHFTSLNGLPDPATEASSSAAETVPLNISTNKPWNFLPSMTWLARAADQYSSSIKPH